MLFLVIFLIFLSGCSATIYQATNISRTNYGITAILALSETGGQYGKLISPLFFNLTYESNTSFRFRITDASSQRYEVPYPDPASYKVTKPDNITYHIVLIANPFSFKVLRLDTELVIFDTSASPLQFSDQFLSIGTWLASSNVYGIGEDAAPIKRSLDDVTHTLWTAGGGYEKGQGKNLYGVHPYYLNLENDGRANGVLLMNSNAMDIILDQNPKPSVTYKTIGGILDFSIFMGSDPVDVTRQYVARIGRSYFPPMWSLGFHLCRWGYNTTGYMESVMEDMILQDVPVDTQWNDIDYMDENKDFTISERFSGLGEYVTELKEQGRHYVMMVDPAIKCDGESTYEPYTSGVKDDIFIRDSQGNIIVGKVWPGKTAFPDFLNPNTQNWWNYWLQKLHKENVDYDGIWIDMNEPESFYDGSVKGCDWNNTYENPPYKPSVRERLQWSTLCMAAKQYTSIHYNVHSLYGWSEAQTTYRALKTINPNKRWFILSRSTFVGSGRWTAHWTGDISSSWDDLKATIPGLLNMNMFGVSMVGADICGFEGDSNAELCVRWSQLGAFYPFSRNHNTLFAKPQEPTAWGTQYTAIIREALLQRYQLLLYLYNLFYISATQGDPVMQALLFQFPTDKNTLDKDRQFMWGQSIMICPTMDEGATKTWVYFPDALWYDLWGGEIISTGTEVQWVTSPLEKINVFARGGAILPIVPTTQALTADQVLWTPKISLYVYLSKSGTAEGSLFIDDGNTESTQGHRLNYNLVNFLVTNNELVVNPIELQATGYVRIINEIKVNGIEGHVTGVNVGGRPWTSWTFDMKIGQLWINKLEIPTGFSSKVSWIHSTYYY